MGIVAKVRITFVFKPENPLLKIKRMHWMLDRWSLAKSKEEDLKYVSEADYVKIRIWFCHCKIPFLKHCFFNINKVFFPVIQKLAKRLQLRQQVVATAFVYFKRFYIK